MINLTAKEKADLFYKLESKNNNLWEALQETRNEPGLSLKDISNIIKRVFDKAEIETLIRELK